ncbi:MAG: GGDEF domain-containing protein [Deltaproteobacteria bacterium]
MVPPDIRPEGTESWSIAPPRPSSERRPYLLVLAGPQLGEIFPLELNREVVLGRDPACDFRLRDTGVSRRHASIVATIDGARLRDMGSTNGIFVEGTRVGDCKLQDGQRVQMGMHTALKFCLCDDMEITFQRRLAEGALLDPETGLFNRRHFDDRLSSELVTASRHTRPMSLLLVAIDGLTHLRETAGSAAADEVLMLVSRLVKSSIRREDVLARLNAEHFGVVARETPLSAGRALGERIRATVERGPVSIRGEILPLTASVSVVGIDSIATYSATRTDAEVLAMAETALRHAIAEGGNRVEARGPLSLP